MWPQSYMHSLPALPRAQRSFSTLGPVCQVWKNRQHHTCYFPLQYLVKKALVTPCLTLCDPMDCSPPSPSVHGILQVSILEWVAISYSMREKEHWFLPDWINGVFWCLSPWRLFGRKPELSNWRFLFYLLRNCSWNLFNVAECPEVSSRKLSIQL